MFQFLTSYIFIKRTGKDLCTYLLLASKLVIDAVFSCVTLVLLYCRSEWDEFASRAEGGAGFLPLGWVPTPAASCLL